MVFQFLFFSLNKTSQVALSKANTFQYSEREQRRPHCLPCHVVELPYLPPYQEVCAPCTTCDPPDKSIEPYQVLRL